MPIFRAQIADHVTGANPCETREDHPRLWLTKLRENLGTSDGDVRKLMGKRSPEENRAALVDGTKLTDAKLRARLLTGVPRQSMRTTIR